MAWKAALILVVLSGCVSAQKTVTVCTLRYDIGTVECSNGFTKTFKTFQQMQGYQCVDNADFLKVAERLQECAE